VKTQETAGEVRALLDLMRANELAVLQWAAVRAGLLRHASHTFSIRGLGKRGGGSRTRQFARVMAGIALLHELHQGPGEG
jgi:hypothetical protein